MALLVMSGLLAATACQPRARTAEKKSIVVTYSILGSVVKDLVEDAATVSVLVPNGVDPHEFQPSARDIEMVNGADLVVQNGLGLEAGLERVLEGARNRGVPFFTASDYVTVRHVGPGEGLASDDPDQDVGAPDPHLWVDPLEIKAVAEALGKELESAFGLDVPGRAADLAQRLDSLHREVADTVAAVPQQDRKLVTGHESLGYFARRYGFQLVGAIIPSLGTQAGVSAAELAALKRTIEENNVKAIFTELGTPDNVAETIAAETGVRVVKLNAALLPPDGSYATFMRDIARTIAEALQ